MKTIYDLTIGDSYWCKSSLGRPLYETIGNKRYPEYDKESHKEFNARLFCGNVFLTLEECQKSIDYDVALAKIKQRASELEYRYSDEDERKIYTIWNEEEALYVAPHSKTNAFKLTFKASETAIIIKEELPEECKTVLDDNCIYVGDDE